MVLSGAICFSEPAKMIPNNVYSPSPRPLEHFTRGLLATSCLTVVCGASATAATITEGTPPAPAYFPTTAPGYLLPLGTTQVIGHLGGELPGEQGFDGTAWFEFTGLTGSGSYTITAMTAAAEDGFMVAYGSLTMQLGTNLDIGEAGTSPVSQIFTAPVDGNLLVEVFIGKGEGEGAARPLAQNPPQGFAVSLANNSSTPEPATIGAVGLGLGAIAFAWRRRRAS
jgi:hypothetical protein